ncbi:chemotaxis protein chel [Frigidibacter sp. MR17.24]|uniref:chemotaxis protein chel n=1 Tax=Frigidibacter sp. MR17.24 TaxID=3127345 RepID=UPI003012BB52
MDPVSFPVPSAQPGPPGSVRLPSKAEAVDAFEASFLATVFKEMGLGRPRESFGGGIGEEQVASMICDAQARAIVAAGGIGLAERLLTAGAFADAAPSSAPSGAPDE